MFLIRRRKGEWRYSEFVVEKTVNIQNSAGKQIELIKWTERRIQTVKSLRHIPKSNGGHKIRVHQGTKGKLNNFSEYQQDQNCVNKCDN